MSWRRRPQAFATPPKLRTFEWCRLRNDFPAKTLWRTVARRIKLPVHQVLSVVVCLECLANASDPRGSVADLCVADVATALDLRPDVVARIRAALEEPDISWIAQDFIVDFSRRNPDDEDMSRREADRIRQRQCRAKKKAAQAQHPAQSTGPPSSPQCHVTSRDVTVTVTEEQNRFISATAEMAERESARTVVGASSGETGENVPPELWLEVTGRRIVVERMECAAPIAAVKIERWLREVEGDAAALASIIGAAEQADYVGQRFHNLIVDGIRRHKIGTRGPQLPLPPAPLRRVGHG